MQIPSLLVKVQKAIKASLLADQHYLLAVSGGADSLALAHACAVLAQQGWGYYSVCHVEHGLRAAESLRDMELVKQFCRQHKLPCYVERVDVLSLAEAEHLSLEEAARNLRYAALRRTASAVGAKMIATAHHRGDQAETVLIKLLRGAGLDGLAGMRSCQNDIIRPLLAIDRSELVDYCRLTATEYCIDSTNADTVYTRNRVRLLLLPLLQKQFNPEIIPTLARTANSLAQDADCLTQLADELYIQSAKIKADSISFSAAVLMQQPAALRQRLLRRAYFALGGKELSYERTLALESLCRSRIGGKLIQLPGKIAAVYKKKQIIFIKSR